MKKLIATVAMLGLSAGAFALEVGGVKLDDKVNVGASDLVLNGAGVRSKFGLAKVYVAGLYLPAKSNNADAIVADKKARRVVLVMKRDVDADKMLEAFHDGIAANSSGPEMEALKPKIAQLDSVFKAVKEARENDRIALDIGADGGVKITINGQAKDSISGPDIGPAMLKIWLGKKPVQDDLKKSMLGS